MKFGKIDYINLLPFYVYLKRYNGVSFIKGTPFCVNEKFKRKLVDGAFISSIEAKNKKCLNLGIVAKKEVRSVFVKKGTFKKDKASATSNVLAKVLGLNGEVIIGDKALKLYLENNENLIDLAQQWNKKYNLPFVFALLCVNKNRKKLAKIAKNFPKKVYIPQYILSKYSKSRQIPKKEILKYLRLISYEINEKEKMALKKFYKLSKAHFLVKVNE